MNYVTIVLVCQWLARKIPKVPPLSLRPARLREQAVRVLQKNSDMAYDKATKPPDGSEKDVKDHQDQFDITAQPQNAALARERIKRAAVQAGFRSPELDDIEVAVGEAATNAILYGSPTATSRIVISCWFNQTEGAFHVEIRDQGLGFDPDKVRDEDDTDSLGGRGLRLMRALMDRLLLYYDGEGMSVRLTKFLPTPNPEQ